MRLKYLVLVKLFIVIITTTKHIDTIANSSIPILGKFDEVFKNIHKFTQLEGNMEFALFQTIGILNICNLKELTEYVKQNIPMHIHYNMVFEPKHMSAKNLPQEVKPTIADRDFVIATVAAPTIIKEPEKPAEGEIAEGAEGEAAQTAEGAEGATTPAKDGEAPKKDDKGKDSGGDKKSATEKKPAEKK